MAGRLEFSLRSRVGALSVTQLVRTVRETLELNLQTCWVVGEVSNARVAPSNHFYFTLKDAQSAINVVMFHSAYRRLRFRVADGMKIVVRGRVSVYEPRGTLQFYAEELEPRGLGALQLAFEQLKQRLASEGLFDPARKRPIPFMPHTIGIVTTLRGAGLRDMLTIMLGRFPNLHLLIRPARVQGAGAAAEIAEAIGDLNRDGRPEVIIVGRGGGSLEDLWAFNEEAVARAIHRSATPVISAVGHEIDYTIADFVADLRAPTPTAAAQMVVPAKAELRERLDETYATLGAALTSVLTAERRQLDHLNARLKDPRLLIRQARQRLDEAAADLAGAFGFVLEAARSHARELGARLRGPTMLVRANRRIIARLALHLARSISAKTEHTALGVSRLAAGLKSAGLTVAETHRRRLAELAARLDSLSPLRVLDRGYAVVISPRDGRAVREAASVQVGDDLDIRLARGRLSARITAREI